MNRLFLTSLLAAIGMFAWSSIAHMVLPLGQAGIQEIPNEQAILGPLQATLGGTSGMYIFPGMGPGDNQQKMAAYEKKLASSPNGLLIYHPAGGTTVTGRQLTVEFLAEWIEAALALFLLAQTRLTGFAARAGFVAVAGLIAAVTTNISYWNWYGFPGTYTVAYMTTQLVGFLVAGLIGAVMMARSSATNRALSEAPATMKA